jgi:GDPmannose 4,6-dehydratase
MKRALITGVSGQDGYFLSKLLLAKDYKVFGMINGQSEDTSRKLNNELPEVVQIKGDLSDTSSLMSAISEAEPHEIYNLGAVSHVGISFTQPELTANVTGLGVLRLLEAIRNLKKQEQIRVYQASSSEIYGRVREVPQNELTPLHPRSPYGCAKSFAHHICVNYREAYGMYISCGILFNHESEKRGHEFVTRKISSGVARIKHNKQLKIKLGNIEAKRDWGYAGDYVQAMWLMLQQDKPDDFVIATGETHTVREFAEIAIKVAGLNGPVEEFIDIDPAFVRPSEVDILIGDSTKAKNVLGWKAQVKFEELVQLMVKNDLILEK